MATLPLHPIETLQLQRKILERIAQGDALQTTLDDLCRLVEEIVSDSACSVMEMDPIQGALGFRAGPSLPDQTWCDFSGLVPGEFAGSCGAAFHTRAPAIATDTRTDPRWEGLRDIAERYGIRACWSIPILRDGEALGTFAISRTVVGGPTDEQMLLLTTSANLAGLAFGRALDEEHLNEQRELLRSLLESAADPIFAKDLDGRYLLANTAETRGVVSRPEDMIGRTDEEFYGTESARRLREQDSEVIAHERTIDYRSSFLNAELGERTYLVRKSPLRDGLGRVRGLVGIARDVTELDHAQELLRKAQRAESLGVLAGGVAHDFNNLLTGVLGNCSLALEEAPTDSPLRSLLLSIEHAALRAAELTEHMLAYAGRSEVHKQRVALDALVGDVLDLLASSLCRHTRIDLECGHGPLVVDGDATQLRQVVLNLVTNASEALEGESGTVHVRLERKLGVVELEVRDEGRGMDAATSQRIFEPFFTTKPTGRGLGLSAAQGIARGHGGSIQFDSAPGRGTTVVVRLPALEDAPGIDLSEANLDPGQASPGVVLVADDESAVRSLAKRVLEAAGHRVIQASDGQEALSLALEHARELDLLLLDVRMPRMPGDEVLERLRDLDVNTPALLSSGYGECEVAPAIRRGAAFLKKPYRPKELLAAVSHARGTAGRT